MTSAQYDWDEEPVSYFRPPMTLQSAHVLQDPSDTSCLSGLENLASRPRTEHSRSVELHDRHDLNKALDQALYLPENLPLIESLFLEELDVQKGARDAEMEYDPMPANGLENVLNLISLPFEDITGFQLPRQNAYGGTFGRLKAKTRIVFAVLQDYLLDADIDSLVFNFALLRQFTFRNMDNCYVGGMTLVDKRSLHETAITQAHESLHHVLRPAEPLRTNYGTIVQHQLDVRGDMRIAEGAARYLQVNMNGRLAEETGDDRFRYAAREIVLQDIAPLYFAFCQEFGTDPVVSEGELMEEARTFMGGEDFARLQTRLSRPPNEYAEGYALFRRAEHSYEPRAIFDAIKENDVSPLLD